MIVGSVFYLLIKNEIWILCVVGNRICRIDVRLTPVC